MTLKRHFGTGCPEVPLASFVFILLFLFPFLKFPLALVTLKEFLYFREQATGKGFYFMFGTPIP